MARKRRVKEKGAAWYHIIARVVNQEYLLESDRVKSRLLDLLHRALEFSGVELGTYTIMDNHFHLFVHVPEACKLDDKEILRRISVLNGEARADAVRRQWDKWQKSGQIERYESDRARFVRRMYDLSEFMKTLKELFTMWYNRTYRHVGTLWTDRFKSVLVEGGNYAERVRVYIEANPVRAGIVDNPTDYCWSGIGAAERGDLIAKQGQTLLADERVGEIKSCKEDERTDEKVPLVTDVPIIPNRRVIPFSNGKILGSQSFVTRIVRIMGFFSRRTHAWPLKEIEFGQKVFAALGYKNDFIAIIAA